MQFPRQRSEESEPFECPQPTTCQFPGCACGPYEGPEEYQDLCPCDEADAAEAWEYWHGRAMQAEAEVSRLQATIRDMAASCCESAERALTLENPDFKG